jgi:hypothetical protein
VEATLSASRSRVATSSTVGNTANSSGRGVYTATRITTRDSAMLKVNSTSSASGGSGMTIMASSAMSSSGVTSPALPTYLRLSRKPPMDQVSPGGARRSSSSGTGRSCGGAGVCAPARVAARNW